MLLKITFPVEHVKLRAQFGYGRSTELIPWARKMSATDVGTCRNVIPSTSSSPGSSPTSVAGQDSEKVLQTTFAALDNSTTAVAY